jgi:lipid-binding SYLF domain-containing protein
MKKKVQISLTLVLLFLSWIMLSGFWDGKSVAEEKKEILKESQKTLQLLYKYVPEAKKVMKNSYGYATFSNTGVNVLVVSTERGVGVAHDNKTGKNIFMNMFSGGAGVGFGVKDFRAVFFFKNKKVFYDFVNSGWEANAQADAAAKYQEDGKAVAAAITVAPGIKLYKLTKNGIALQATIQGTKYWKDDELNK